jgi:CspA family cold shock protein
MDLTPGLARDAALGFDVGRREAAPNQHGGPSDRGTTEAQDMTDAGNRRPRRSRGKRGFDDDFSGPEPGWSPPPSFGNDGPPRRGPPRPSFAAGPETEATVKWFNGEKGFGFVELGDGSGDAFLHASVLERAGIGPVNPGAQLKVRVGPGQKGLQVAEVTELTDPGSGTPPPSAPRPPRPAFRAGGPGPGPAPEGGEEMRGTVKWYSREKGFGFVTPENGGKDVFVHATALERSGLQPLADGQAVVIRVVQGRKGPEAATVELA